MPGTNGRWLRTLDGFIAINVSIISEAVKYDVRYAPKFS
jgi:hypothetical protein